MTTFLNKCFYESSRYNASDEEDLEPQVTTGTGPLPPTPQLQQAIATRDTKKLDVLTKHVEGLMKHLGIKDEAPQEGSKVCSHCHL